MLSQLLHSLHLHSLHLLLLLLLLLLLRAIPLLLLLLLLLPGRPVGVDTEAWRTLRFRFGALLVQLMIIKRIFEELAALRL